MLKCNNFRLYWLPVLSLSILVVLSAGCDISIGGTSQKTPTTPATVELNGTPKGPGSANLTATARASVGATGCSTVSAAAASTNGWKIYKDTHFSFQFAIPPGWKAGSFTDGSGSDYIAAVLPIESTIPFEYASGAPEHFQISVQLAGPITNPGTDPSWRSETTPITISGMKTTLYDLNSPDCGEVDRIAVADFGKHHFIFYMASIAEKAKNNLALFLGILQSFDYMG